MKENNSIVAIYPSHTAAETAIKELQKSGFDMKKLSIVGRDYHTDEHVVGYYNTGDRMGEIGDSRAALALMQALEDDKFDVRWLAVRAVVALGRAGLAALLQALIERPHSTLLRESAHHVLHDEADEKWSRQLDPLIQALEGCDPQDAVPVSAEKAWQVLFGAT